MKIPLLFSDYTADQKRNIFLRAHRLFCSNRRTCAFRLSVFADIAHSLPMLRRDARMACLFSRRCENGVCLSCAFSGSAVLFVAVSAPGRAFREKTYRYARQKNFGCCSYRICHTSCSKSRVSHDAWKRTQSLSTVLAIKSNNIRAGRRKCCMARL